MFALIAAASVGTPVDAERAFIRDAHAQGQWTAFRKWADWDPVMFVPRAVWAQEFLNGRADPPRSIDWARAESWVSCDGRTAINRGPWSSQSGAHGSFTTVWMKSRGTWRWAYDGGAPAPASVFPKNVKVVHASCRGLSSVPAAYRRTAVATARIAGQGPADAGQGRSADGTLIYQWKVAADGSRHFLARLWTGRGYRAILEQAVPAPQAQ